jgi:subtilisin-like proprotein convertase family protein
VKTNMLKPAALIAAMAAVVSLPVQAAETTCVAAGGTNCPAQIPDAPQTPPLTSTMTVPQLTCPGGLLPTGVAIRVNITHNWTGDLAISVSNPNAVSATLKTASPLTDDGQDLFQTYTSATLIGAGTGAWTLTVQDTANGNDGALNDWGVDAVCPRPQDIPTLSPLPMLGLGLLLAALGGLGLRRSRGR